MKAIQFKDFITLQRGFDLPRHSRDEGEYPVIAATGMHGSHSEFKVYPPGVITGRSGSLGEVVFVERPYWPLNTTLWVKDFKGNDPRYVYYFLKTLDLKRFNSGAGVPTLNRNHLDTLLITVHDSQSQIKIAAILSAYDDLIENNLRRIKIVEEMAQTLYREWFVKFRFPGHQKVRMVNSPLGKIPEGWEVGTLDDVLTTLESGSRPKGGIDPEARGVPSIGAENIIGLGRYDYSKQKFVTRDFFNNMNRGHIQSGDVVLYKDGAQIGRKSMFRDGFPHVECCINEHVFILRSNGRCSQNYLFFWLDQPEMTQNIINLNANAAQPGINQSGVRGLSILLPPASLLKIAEQVLEPMMGALFNNAKRNNILRQTRDLLLPKLINGELDVSDLDVKIVNDGLKEF
jgi:type I restriction enzyme S subunit